ncbi:MAG: amidohydrolase family protein [Myxococcales bacterium]|nr:amidohydrolase family protein [Myxococcales bacterium]
MSNRPTRPPAIPTILQRRSTDEFAAPLYTEKQRGAVRRVLDDGPRSARRVAEALGDYWRSRRGTAAGLRSLNDAIGVDYYQVPREASLDQAAADEALGGDDVVIDVQTHYVADRSMPTWRESLIDTYRALMPTWWTGLDGFEAHNLAEYLRCVFLESETALAVLTSAPGLEDTRMLWNEEMSGTRELLDRLGADGRLLNHAVVHPDAAGEVDAMARVQEQHQPAGWKVYTIGHMAGMGFVEGSDWWLDDEKVGVPFLERVRELGNPVVCAHKGISALVPTGSPRDIGPAAVAFPDLQFLIYHSAYEMPMGDDPEEGPYTAETANVGTNRLVTTLRDAKLAPGSNVYAELGTTWFCLIRRPQEAAHVLGKLLLAVGEDNVIWGSDSIWYGPTQPAIDAFRAFQIPEEMRERYGYPEITPAMKRKILGENAARVYDLDIDGLRSRTRDDDLAWVKAAIDEYRAHGVPVAAGSS